jgi:hypothetical protein
LGVSSLSAKKERACGSRRKRTAEIGRQKALAESRSALGQRENQMSWWTKRREERERLERQRQEETTAMTVAEEITKPQEAPTVEFKWMGLDDIPIFFTNAFGAAIYGKDEFIVTLGHIAPPLWTKDPTPEDIANVKVLQIKPVVRLGMTPGRLAELIEVLQRVLKNYNDAQLKK